jgi:2-dehydro-3-deoxyphosphogluconate aldolase/(4S)-4-hydroxy-2-oxoglutarate aldolase
MTQNSFDVIAHWGVLPVVAIETADNALPLGDAFSSGGLPLIEVTFRTSAAAEAINRLTKERPALLVGAGTVLTLENLRAAKQAGAQFAVAPGCNPEIVKAARDMNLPFIPGVATPSEVEQAMALGCKLLKFFPAEALGGIPMLDALFGPYGHTGARFVPTGGVNLGNLEAYLRCKAVSAVGGTWLAKKEDILAGKWDAIRERIRATAEIVRHVRSHVHSA